MKGIVGNARGMTLLLSMMTLASTSVLIIGIFGITRLIMRESVFQKRAAQAQAIAEAGLEDAFLQLRLNPAWRAGFAGKPFAGGSYTVTLSAGASPVAISVGSSQSIAFFGAARATIQATAQLAAAVNPCPILSGTSRMSIQASVDAYDSSVNPNPTSFGFGSNVCSNDKVQIPKNQGFTVNGDAYYGKGPAPDPSTVVGVVYSSTFTRTVPFHDGSAYAGSNNNSTGMSPLTYYNAGSKQLNIPSGKSVTLAPGTYYFNALTINSGSTLTANNAAGPVTIFLNGDLNLNGAFANATNIPSRLLIYPQGSNNVNLQASSGAFYGIVEGPNAGISTSQVVYGKISGASVSISSNFHYDVQTAGTSAVATHVAWQIGSWSSN